MKGEGSNSNRKDSVLIKLGLFSFLIGIFFWTFIGVIAVDHLYLKGFFWKSSADILGNGHHGKWLLLGGVFIILPVVTHSLGLLCGFLGLWSSKRIFAVLGLMVNAVLPILIFLYKINHGF